jgi:hypothetical protein
MIFFDSWDFSFTELELHKPKQDKGQWDVIDKDIVLCKCSHVSLILFCLI